MSRYSRNDVSLFLLFSFTGVYSLISQTVILREFFVIMNGNEYYFGLILSIWFIGISSGAFFGRKLSKGRLKNFLFSIILMVIYFPFMLFMIRAFNFLSGTPTGNLISYDKVLLISPLLIIPFSFLIGFQFPAITDYITKGRNSDNSKDVSKISNLYIVESTGALTGGVLYTFLFVGKISPFNITAIITIHILILIYRLIQPKNVKTVLSLIMLLMLFLLMIFPPVTKFLEKKSSNIRWSGISDERLIYSGDSKFQNISISVNTGQFSLFLNGRLTKIFPDTQTGMLLAAQLFVQNENPRSILIIGFPDPVLYTYLKQYGFKKIVFAEIDKKAVEKVEQYTAGLWYSSETGFRESIIFEDGRRYIKREYNKIKSEKKAETLFDIVFVNTGDPSSLYQNRYFTKEFFNEVLGIIGNSGTLVLKVTSSDNYEPGYFGYYTSVIYKTFKSIFPSVAFTTGESALLFGSLDKKSVTENSQILEKRYIKSGMKPEKIRYLFRYIYDKNILKKRTRFLNELGDISLNSDKNPIAVFYYNRLERNYRDGSSASVISFFKTHEVVLLLSVLFIIILSLAILLKSSKNSESGIRFSTGIVLFLSAAVTISCELIIIYLYQVLFGYIYSRIGLIIAIFMAGIPLGALFSESVITKRRMKKIKEIAKLSLMIQFIFVLVVTFFLLTVKSDLYGDLIMEIVLYSVTLFLGMYTGGIFSSSIHILSFTIRSKTSIAGFADALDHLGAFFGAFLTGMVTVPILGISVTAGILIIFLNISIATTFFIFKNAEN